MSGSCVKGVPVRQPEQLRTRSDQRSLSLVKLSSHSSILNELAQNINVPVEYLVGGIMRKVTRWVTWWGMPGMRRERGGPWGERGPAGRAASNYFGDSALNCAST